VRQRSRSAWVFARLPGSVGRYRDGCGGGVDARTNGVQSRRFGRPRVGCGDPLEELLEPACEHDRSLASQADQWDLDDSERGIDLGNRVGIASVVAPKTTRPGADSTTPCAALSSTRALVKV
jgi:hypothetical protein